MHDTDSSPIGRLAIRKPFGVTLGPYRPVIRTRWILTRSRFILVRELDLDRRLKILSDLKVFHADTFHSSECNFTRVNPFVRLYFYRGRSIYSFTILSRENRFAPLYFYRGRTGLVSYTLIEGGPFCSLILLSRETTLDSVHLLDVSLRYYRLFRVLCGALRKNRIYSFEVVRL